MQVCFFDEVECVFAMVVVSVLPLAEFGPDDHGEDPTHFTHLYKSRGLTG